MLYNVTPTVSFDLTCAFLLYHHLLLFVINSFPTVTRLLLPNTSHPSHTFKPLESYDMRISLPYIMEEVQRAQRVERVVRQLLKSGDPTPT